MPVARRLVGVVVGGDVELEVGDLVGALLDGVADARRGVLGGVGGAVQLVAGGVGGIVEIGFGLVVDIDLAAGGGEQQRQSGGLEGNAHVLAPWLSGGVFRRARARPGRGNN